MCTLPPVPVIWIIRQVAALAAVVGGSATVKYLPHRHTNALTQPQMYLIFTFTHTHCVTMTNILPLWRHRLSLKVSSVSINKGACDWLLVTQNLAVAFFDWFKPSLAVL